ncbi:hypothetical protein BB559_003059 [Furculomyces boomerangus]|uniref:Uncharacterized protein n=2 Tax=Harpellales TaxID=61421 RepID=A0A2T9YPF7_9FUNG|nr:hypothetical protein BB559_003059 [Furculomyces boomerangus]PVZ96593.1 hypothetical protein BB558_007490 [Smittium angustum]
MNMESSGTFVQSDKAQKPISIKELRDKAKLEYQDSVAERQKIQQLNFLLERSTIYAGFLASKMERQIEERKIKNERKMKKRLKKLEKKNEAKVKDLKMATRSKINPEGSNPQSQTIPDPKENSSKPANGTKKKKNLKDFFAGNTENKSIESTSENIAPSSIDINNLSDELVPINNDKNTITQDTFSPIPTSIFDTTNGSIENNEKDKDTHASQPRGIVGKMRKYQIEGMEWLISLYENGLNGILADEMGLGKTLQTIAFLTFLREQEVWGPFLIVCPLSTLGNWVSEFHRFSPSTPVVLYHGMPEERARLRKKNLSQQLGKKFPVIVTTYEIVMRDSKHLKHFAWKYIVVDEGHRLKNLNCQLIKELRSYHSANRLLLTGTPLHNKLSELWSLLNFLLPEIFDDLEAFQEWFDFDDINNEAGQNRIIGQEATNQVVSKLHHILQPFLLRRLKIEVENELPPKREYAISCPMTTIQLQYYTAALDNGIRKFLYDKLTKDSTESPNKLIEAVPTANGENDSKKRRRASKKASKAIKKFIKEEGIEMFAMEEPKTVNSEDIDGIPIPNETETIDKQANEISLGEDQLNNKTSEETLNGYKEQDNNSDEEGGFSDGDHKENMLETNAKKQIANFNLKYKLMQLRKISNHPYLFDFPLLDPEDPESDYLVDESLVRSSGKFLILDILLPQLVKMGHRVLLFSQMTKMMDLLEIYFELRKYKFCRIDGSVMHDERRRQINAFNTDMDIHFFLLSTRAGGLGINLTSADTVVILDSDWNPQMDLQAMDRVHRIGQEKPVVVYRLVTAGSVDEFILDRANGKRKLEKLVIHQKKFKGVSSYAAAVPNSLGQKNKENGSSLGSVFTVGNDNVENETWRSKSVGGASIGLEELAEILTSEATERVRQDQAKIVDQISSLPLDKPVPSEWVISKEILDEITDRSPEAYNKTKEEI